MSHFNLTNLPCRQGGVIVDVGMNRGQFALEAIEKFNPSIFLGVEMISRLAGATGKVLRQWLGDRVNVMIADCAVGERCGRTTYRCVPALDDASSILDISPAASEWYGRDLRQSEREPVNIHTLDCLCVLHGIEEIDLLKIDVQGYEGRVLLGAQEILKRTRAIIIEVLFETVYEWQSSAGAIDLRLFKAGFEMQEWLRRDSVGERLLEGDALWVRK